jgi:hypothetical protein
MTKTKVIDEINVEIAKIKWHAYVLFEEDEKLSGAIEISRIPPFGRTHICLN